MESAPCLETVLHALQALYHNQDASGTEKASVWLGELQKSVFAWEVADQLLRLHRDVESCYFAAQTMRTKIQYAFHELPPDTHPALRESLMDHVSKVSPDTDPVIITQLSLALADFSLQMVTWKDSASEIVQRFGSSPQHIHFLVEFLTVLPEEAQSRTLRLGANRREAVSTELTQTIPLVLNLLSSILENGNSDVYSHKKVFQCLSSWLNMNTVPQDLIINSKLLTAPFQVLMDKESSSSLHEAASDCICAAVYCCEDLDKYGLMAQSLFQGVMTLPKAYQEAVAAEDVDKAVNLCRIFTEMSESLLEFMLSHPNQGLGDLRQLEMLLNCVGHNEYEVAEITFNFWYRLSEELYSKDNTQLNDLFMPYAEQLIRSLSQHCHYDLDHEGVPNDDDDFNEFRQRVSDLVQDIVFLVGSATCFKQMYQQLQQTSPERWNEMEAALFIMSAVAKNITPSENVIVPQVLNAVLSQKSTELHVAVRYTSIQLIGELSEWIDSHTDVLDPVLQFLLAGLQQPLLATAAANALQKICSKCKGHMVKHFTGLLHIVQALDSFNVSNDAAIGLLKGAAMTLAQMSGDQVTDGFRQLCAIQASPLAQILQQESSTAAAEKTPTTKDPTVWLDRLAAIFRHTTPTITNGQPHPCKAVIEELWPILSDACNKYQGDTRIIERCCRCIRFAIRCVGKGSSALLSPLVAQMISLYSLHPHSCFLYLGSILVDEYGSETGCTQGLIDMITHFCTPTFKILEEHNGLRNHPDTVDDLFRLCLRSAQRIPLAFLQCSLIKNIFCCAIAACSCDHREANASVMKFLQELIKCAREKDHNPDYATRKSLVKSILSEHGQTLVQALVNACVFSLPSFMIFDVGDVIYELLQMDRPLVCKWLETALKSLPTETAGGAISVTTQQLTGFHKEVTSAENEKQVSHALKEFSRLYR